MAGKSAPLPAQLELKEDGEELVWRDGHTASVQQRRDQYHSRHQGVCSLLLRPSGGAGHSYSANTDADARAATRTRGKKGRGRGRRWNGDNEGAEVKDGDVEGD